MRKTKTLSENAEEWLGKTKPGVESGKGNQGNKKGLCKSISRKKAMCLSSTTEIN